MFGSGCYKDSAPDGAADARKMEFVKKFGLEIPACQPKRDCGTSAANFMNPIQIPDNGGKSVSILDIPMFIRVHGRDTNGTVAVVESHDVTGGVPPPHIHHREDETFQILVLAMVDVRGRTAARHVVGFDHGHRAVRVAAMHADEHGDRKSVV